MKNFLTDFVEFTNSLSILICYAFTMQDPVLLPLLIAKLDDSDFPLAILHYALSLVENPEPIIHTEASPLITQLDKKESKVYGGSLLRAKDTICYLGDMTRLKKDTLEAVKSGKQAQMP